MNLASMIDCPDCVFRKRVVASLFLAHRWFSLPTDVPPLRLTSNDSISETISAGSANTLACGWDFDCLAVVGIMAAGESIRSKNITGRRSCTADGLRWQHARFLPWSLLAASTSSRSVWDRPESDDGIVIHAQDAGRTSRRLHRDSRFGSRFDRRSLFDPCISLRCAKRGCQIDAAGEHDAGSVCS